MEILDEKTVVVLTSAELKEALEGNNGYTLIYFGADITLTNGITISSTKTNITIDGTYKNITYQYTDQKSTSAAQAIQASPQNQLITIQNIHIIGYNYYGMVYVAESANYKNVVLQYQNITYVGPQFIFHPIGLTRILNSTITVQEQYASGNEVAECNKIEIGGNTSITHTSKSNSSFWFRNDNPSFTILKDAYVQFTSTERELFYGTNQLTLTINENAYFEVNVHNGLAYNSSFGTGVTTIAENAFFKIVQTARNGGYATWYSYGPLSVNANATLQIISNYTGITTSNPCIYFYNANASFTLNQPQEVVLYNSAASAIQTSATIPFQFRFSRINLFSTVIPLISAISQTNLPTYAWYKKDSIASINGTFSNTTTTITASNFTEDELKDLPSLSNFVLANKKIISLGLFSFSTHKIGTKTTRIRGKTLKNVSILIQYLNTSEVITATESGDYSYTMPNTLELGTIITITAKLPDNVIYSTLKEIVVEPGDLVLAAYPTTIEFSLDPFSLTPLLLPKKEKIELSIIDTRIELTKWKLYASLASSFQDTNGNVLENAICFFKDQALQPLSNLPLLIYEAEEENEGTTNLTYIKAGAFANCKGLTSINLPKSIQRIDESAFASCGVISITINSEVPPILEQYALNYSTVSIYVPAEALETYKSADGWSDYADKIFAIEE